MKVRDSGMPDAVTWDAFFNAEQTLLSLGFDDAVKDVVDFGCGYGTFTVAAARLTAGTVVALDIDDAMVKATETRASVLNLHNVDARQRDFIAMRTGLPANSADFAMLFNILHGDNPVALLEEAFRVLRAGGRAGAIHWVYDSVTPRGPSLAIRPRPEQIVAWLRQAGFEILVPHVALPPYHFGVVGRKAGA